MKSEVQVIEWKRKVADHPLPTPARSCEIIARIAPTLALPHQGGGNSLHVPICLPSPLAGEGRVRGIVPSFLFFILVAFYFGIGTMAFAQTKNDWAQVNGPRIWTFPQDHGAHPEYRTEWWYFTGNLRDDAGSRYGYQLTFFRQGIQGKISEKASPWDIRDLYLAHLAITDVSKNQFRSTERV